MFQVVINLYFIPYNNKIVKCILLEPEVELGIGRSSIKGTCHKHVWKDA